MTTGFLTAVLDQKYTEAAKVLDAAIASCRHEDKQALATLLINRGHCHHRVQLYRKALKDYDAALEAIPQHPLALYRKGQVLAAQKKLEDARSAWEEALRACSERTDIQLVLDISAALRDPHGVKAGH
ncbi:hypothetical protein GPECTOR_68g358 [Gonium pectorale]|uniref:Uncharacterized protein n=1 Tax=Gonium pectorale TaxID=33097 RepID=A0A150G3F4_GONPE|nr:hypothetical protein GPECTOR_68g358 [Gonium pectorale]|eukprot:KXZ44387.1 hypothetical protein GPECTOR_68g358 [Gonium pectorale]